jgi:hypothetical protein
MNSAPFGAGAPQLPLGCSNFIESTLLAGLKAGMGSTGE